MFHFLYQVVDPSTDKQAYSQQFLAAEANLLVVAGLDTTSISLYGFFIYIVRNPRSYEKLVKEIRSTFNSPYEIFGGSNPRPASISVPASTKPCA